MGQIKSKGRKSRINRDRNITPCGAHLKALRKSKGMSQEALGFELQDALGCGDIDKGRISKWENGGGMRESVLAGYKKVFGCEVDYLLGKSSAPHLTENKEKALDRIKDRKELKEYMQQHRAALVQYAAELCDCWVDIKTVGDKEYYDIHAEICTDCIDGLEGQGLQQLNYPCTAAEFNLLTQQVDRAIENAFKTFIEMRVNYNFEIGTPIE